MVAECVQYNKNSIKEGKKIRMCKNVGWYSSQKFSFVSDVWLSGKIDPFNDDVCC